jgi:DinB superfamily
MSLRPQPTEADPYYFAYIEQVPGDDVLAVLPSQMGEVLFPLAGVSEDKSLYRYEPGKWSVRQVLHHVSDTERVLAFRALWFARGFEAPLPSYDQNFAASGAQADRIRWTDHLEEFRRVRLASISLFQNLPPEAWQRSGIASDKPFTVRALAFIIAGHTAHHFRILRERYGL